MGFIQIEENNGNSVYGDKVIYARLALGSLMLNKKELETQKKQTIENTRQIATYYKDSISRSNLKTHGGFIRKFIKYMCIFRYRVKCKKLANQLAYYEQERKAIETVLVIIDKNQIELEMCLLEDSKI
jgi:hypothetical protein